MIRNWDEERSNPNKSQIVQVPFTVCSLKENTEYLVQVSEDRKKVNIYSEFTPVFYNDNHVLSSMKLLPE